MFHLKRELKTLTRVFQQRLMLLGKKGVTIVSLKYTYFVWVSCSSYNAPIQKAKRKNDHSEDTIKKYLKAWNGLALCVRLLVCLRMTM